MGDERRCTAPVTALRQQQQSSSDSSGGSYSQSHSHGRCRSLLQMSRSSPDQLSYKYIDTVEDCHSHSHSHSIAANSSTNMQYFCTSSSTACSCSSCSDVTTWPPRFYPCSFCRRQFTSAQALGGHMNVHRRDRARLTNLPLPYVCYSTNFSKAAGGTAMAAAGVATPPSPAVDDLHHQYDKLCSLAGLDDVIQPSTPYRPTHNSTANLIRVTNSDRSDESHSLDLELRLGI